VKRVHVDVAPAPPQGANYLILGSDTRNFVSNSSQKQAFGAQSSGANSDTIMVAHVEPNLKKTLIVSFPRDLWVSIPGQGMAKINAALSQGPDKTIQTLQADFGIPINHYISVDFESFQAIVNTIGRVPVYFPYAARDRESDLGVYAGCQLLNGAQALAYARSRTMEFYTTNTHQWKLADPTADIGRIARQQQFIRELAGIAVQRSLEDPITATQLVDRVLKYLEFDQNLTKGDIFNLIDVFRTASPTDSSHLEFETIPWKNGPNQGAEEVLYVNQPADEALLARLRDFTGQDTSGSVATITPHSVRVQVADTAAKGRAAGTLSDLVHKAGFQSGGTVASTDVPANTVIRYRPGAFLDAELLLQYLPPTARIAETPTIKGASVQILLGDDFTAISIPTGGGSVSAGQAAGTPTAAGPSGGQAGIDTAASGAGQVSPTVFGPPIADGPPCT